MAARLTTRLRPIPVLGPPLQIGGAICRGRSGPHGRAASLRPHGDFARPGWRSLRRGSRRRFPDQCRVGRQSPWKSTSRRPASGSRDGEEKGARNRSHPHLNLSRTRRSCFHAMAHGFHEASSPTVSNAMAVTVKSAHRLSPRDGSIFPRRGDRRWKEQWCGALRCDGRTRFRCMPGLRGVPGSGTGVPHPAGGEAGIVARICGLYAVPDDPARIGRPAVPAPLPMHL